MSDANSIFKMTAETLSLGDNKLTGSLPDGFYGMKWLNHVVLSGNGISGILSTRLQALSHLGKK